MERWRFCCAVIMSILILTKEHLAVCRLEEALRAKCWKTSSGRIGRQTGRTLQWYETCEGRAGLNTQLAKYFTRPVDGLAIPEFHRMTTWLRSSIIRFGATMLAPLWLSIEAAGRKSSRWAGRQLG